MVHGSEVGLVACKVVSYILYYFCGPVESPKEVFNLGD